MRHKGHRNSLINAISFALDGTGRIGLGIVQMIKIALLPIIIPFRTLHTMVRGMPIPNDDRGLREACCDFKSVINPKIAENKVLSNGFTVTECRKNKFLKLQISYRLLHKVINIKNQGRGKALIFTHEGYDAHKLFTKFVNNNKRTEGMFFFWLNSGRYLDICKNSIGLQSKNSC